MKIEIAGVDEDHQDDHCDDCKKAFDRSAQDWENDVVRTCSHAEYLTLCLSCYRKRGNAVR